VLTVRAQLSRLLVRQNSCVLGEAREITVGGEQVLGVIREPIVQRVDEVEANGSGD